MDSRLIRPAVAVLLQKLVIFSLVMGSATLSPENFNLTQHQANFHWPVDEPVGRSTHFKTWDAQHFLFLAEEGYAEARSNTQAFYPLWPLLIRIGSFVTACPTWKNPTRSANCGGKISSDFCWAVRLPSSGP